MWRARFESFRSKRSVIKDDDFPHMNVTISDDNPEIGCNDTKMSHPRRFISRFSSPPDPGNRPPRAMLGIPRYKNLLPKNVIARLTGAAALGHG